jgi:hypothetical protein
MKISTFPSGPSAEPKEPGLLHLPRRTVASLGVDSQVLVHPETVSRETGTEPWAHRGRGPAVCDAVALWLRCALADSGRAWALAAGVPPDLCNEAMSRTGEDR